MYRLHKRFSALELERTYSEIKQLQVRGQRGSGVCAHGAGIRSWYCCSGLLFCPRVLQARQGCLMFARIAELSMTWCLVKEAPITLRVTEGLTPVLWNRGRPLGIGGLSGVTC